MCRDLRHGIVSTCYGPSWRGAKLTLLGTSLAISAYLTVVALGSADHRWVGWVTLIPLLVSIRVLAPPKAMLAGAFWGLCLLIHWVGNFAGCVLVAFFVAYISAAVLEGLSRVRVVIDGRHLAMGPLDAARRLFAQQSFNALFHFIRPGRPRAPPLPLR